MRNLFRKRKHVPNPDATRARVRAERELAATRAETPRYQALGEQLRQLREHNNFGRAIEATFRGGAQR